MHQLALGDIQLENKVNLCVTQSLSKYKPTKTQLNAENERASNENINQRSSQKAYSNSGRAARLTTRVVESDWSTATSLPLL